MFPKRYIIQSYKQPIWTLKNCWDEQLSKPQIDNSRIGTAKLISLLFLSISNCFMIWLRGYLHEKTHTGAGFIPGWLFDFVWRLHDDAAMLDSNWSYFSAPSYMEGFFADGIIRCLLYDDFLWPHIHMRVCNAYIYGIFLCAYICSFVRKWSYTWE